MLNLATIRNEIVNTNQALCKLGLANPVTSSGNISARLDTDAFLVTPSGVNASNLKARDLVTMDMDGKYESEFAPSSEWRFHRDILASRSDVGAVIHVHSPFATVIACARRDIPPFHYMIAVAGGKIIKCAEYATFGTQELSTNLLAALSNRKACLLANHGLIAVGKNLQEALKVAVEIEELCAQFWRVLQLGEPIILSDTQMDEVLEKFKTYGSVVKVKQTCDKN